MANEIQIVDSHTSFAVLERQWRGLQQSSTRPNVYCSFEWLNALLARGGKRRLSIAIARDNERLVAALPLWQSSPLLPILEPIGSPPLNDPPVLAGHEVRLTELVSRTLGVDQRVSILMKNLSHESPLVTVSGARVTRQRDPELFTAIGGDFESFVAQHFQRKSRNKVRRYAEQFRRAGAQFELITDPVRVTELARRLAPFKWQTLKGTYNTSSVCSAEGRAFLANLAHAGIVRGYSLRLGNNLVAGCLCQLQRDVCWYWIPAYNPDFIRWSPGIALLYFILEHAHREGLRELNYGYGEQMYKSMWASGSRPLVTCEMAGHSRRAQTVLALRHTLDVGREHLRGVGVVAKLNAQIQWVRTRRERAAVRTGPDLRGGLRSVLARARAERLGSAVPTLLLVLPAAKLVLDGHPNLDLSVVGTDDYLRVASLQPWQAPATVLEHFRHGDTCFVARRGGVEVHVSFIDWTPDRSVPHGYAYAHQAFTIPSRGRWDTHYEVLRRIAREAASRGKVGIACSFDPSNVTMLRRAVRAGFQRIS